MLARNETIKQVMVQCKNLTKRSIKGSLKVTKSDSMKKQVKTIHGLDVITARYVTTTRHKGQDR